jgi:hypothetical protein
MAYKLNQDKIMDNNTLPEKITIKLNDDTRFILGRPLFWCGSLSRDLRELGHDIPRKAEEEQAYVIYWMLGLYNQHGEIWRSFFNAYFKK